MQLAIENFMSNKWLGLALFFVLCLLALGFFQWIWKIVRLVACMVVLTHNSRAHEFLRGAWRGRSLAYSLAYFTLYACLAIASQQHHVFSAQDPTALVMSICFWAGLLGMIGPFVHGEKMEQEDVNYALETATTPEQRKKIKESIETERYAQMFRKNAAAGDNALPCERSVSPERPSELAFWVSTFSSACGAVAIINLINRWRGDGLSGLTLELITFYDRIVKTVFDFVFQPLPFSVPFWYRDLYLVSLLLLVALFRAERRADISGAFPINPGARLPNTKTQLIMEGAQDVLVSALFSLVLLGFASFLGYLRLVGREAWHEDLTYFPTRSVYVGSRIVFTVFCMLMGAVVAFSLNYS